MIAKFKNKSKLVILIALVAVAACLAIFYAVGQAQPSVENAVQTISGEPEIETVEPELGDSNRSISVTQTPEYEANHTHNWEINITDVPVPELIKTVHHDAVVKDVTENHTVCNVCKKVIDGETTQHAKETGHKGFTTNVPVTTKQVIEKAWDEKIVVQEESHRSVKNGEICTICKMTKDAKSVEDLQKELGIKTAL